MEYTPEHGLPCCTEEKALEHAPCYRLVAHLAADKTVLHIASGEGYGTSLLAPKAQKVLGVESSQEAVCRAAARHTAPNLQFVQGSVLELPLPDASVDVVVRFGPLEHTDQNAAMLCEIVRVLRPDGVLYLSAPDQDDAPEQHTDADPSPDTTAEQTGERPSTTPEPSEPSAERATTTLGRTALETLAAAHFQHYAVWEQQTAPCSAEAVAPSDGQSDEHDEIAQPDLCDSYTAVLVATNGPALPEYPTDLQQTPGEESDPMATLTTRVQQQSVVIVEKTETVFALEAAVSRLQQELETTRQEGLAARLAQEEAARQAVEAVQQTANYYNELAVMMENSRSWKITRPLRAACGITRGLRSCRGIKAKVLYLISLFRDTPPCPPRENTPAVAPERSAATRSSDDADPLPPQIVFISGDPSRPAPRLKRLAAALCRTGQYRVAEYTACTMVAHQKDILQAELIWLWRAPVTPELRVLLREARQAGIRIVLDIDDLYFHQFYFHTGFVDEHSVSLGHLQRHKFGKRMNRTVKQADLCTTSAEFLAYAVHEKNQKPTLTIPNGFERQDLVHGARVRLAALAAKEDNLLRLGYRVNAVPHQDDLRVMVPALAAVLARHPEVRFVVYKNTHKISDFPELCLFWPQLEWRDPVPAQQAPEELASYDINLLPYALNSSYTHAASETGFFEAALAGVPSIVSATDSLRAIVRHGENGLLAEKPEDWEPFLEQLIQDKYQRDRMAHCALRDVLWTFGPENCERLAASVVERMVGNPRRRAQSFATDSVLTRNLPMRVEVPEYGVVYASGPALAKVAVVIPLYNYANYITEALDSLHAQTMPDFDVIVVDDQSTDNSAEVAQDWLQRHKDRFASVTLLRNKVNSRLSLTRNTGIDYSCAEYIMLLDADNMLLPDCLSLCAAALDNSAAAVAYPYLVAFGPGAEGVKFVHRRWEPGAFRHRNYVDAMTMIRKAHWAALGGYTRQDLGWEDYDLWCKMIGHGFWGEVVPVVAAKYRVHQTSMVHTLTGKEDSQEKLLALMGERYPWLRLK